MFHLGPMPRDSFSNLSGLVWTENILSVFGAKTPFSNLSGLVWTGPHNYRALSIWVKKPVVPVRNGIPSDVFLFSRFS